MNAAQMSKENQELEKKIEQLMWLSDEIRKLTRQQAKINAEIAQVFLLLVSQIKKNTGGVLLQTNPRTPSETLDIIRLLIKLLLHHKETLERENIVLRKIVRKQEN